MASTDAQKRASIKYAKSNVTQIKFSFNNKTDADILEKLNSIDNKQGYIKSLIRNDMMKGGKA